jgi:hypothetical protein
MNKTERHSMDKALNEMAKVQMQHWLEVSAGKLFCDVREQKHKVITRANYTTFFVNIHWSSVFKHLSSLTSRTKQMSFGAQTTSMFFLKRKASLCCSKLLTLYCKHNKVFLLSIIYKTNFT